MLRTRPPRGCPERHPVRLACIRHAASVDPEPGSNSPPMSPGPEEPRPPKRPCCVLMATHIAQLLLLLCLFEQIRPHHGSTKEAVRIRPARSVFGTQRTSAGLLCQDPCTASPCQLVNVLPAVKGKHPAPPKKTSSPTSPEATRTTSGVALLRARRAYRTVHAPVKGPRQRVRHPAHPIPRRLIRAGLPGGGGRSRLSRRTPSLYHG